MTNSPISTPARELLARYDDYASAQAAVDRLSDAEFPVEEVSIIGWNVRIEEQVTGRMTLARAAGYGAASGAWFGLLIGLILGIFAPVLFLLWLLIAATGLGALWGALFGLVGHALWRGKRDFSSVKNLAAEHWDVMVNPAHLDRARTLLSTTQPQH
ncbi:hypothetical protein B5M43_007570 [Microbacterium sp. MEC084]|jgi:uncharacterized membrane protein|uniref:general stress protein n=1 Tax=Microbacterium sp. MEC084 TaxID=1963027 RepID=UPI00106F37F9|nr:general stress protein [Microbacterium sp. MEC084]MCD1268705.1 hypothetical protein [Microbacterium sp. MEC084]